MNGISSSGKARIGQVVEDMFDNLAMQLLGDMPRFKKRKMLVISSKPNLGLSHLFVQSMRNKTPNAMEQDVLKSLLESANGYIESLKNKTKSNVVERVDGLAREARIKGQTMDESEVQAVLNDEMGKARSHMQAVIESEATKLRNLGGMMEISRVATDLGDNDPTVFFIVVKDGTTCKECLRLHLNEGGSPRLWKFSELKQGYHKRGEDQPSAFGLHPHCRCTLAYLSKGFHFKKGMLTYHSQDYDAYAAQSA
jgi:hypothetical protein